MRKAIVSCKMSKVSRHAAVESQRWQFFLVSRFCLYGKMQKLPSEARFLSSRRIWPRFLWCSPNFDILLHFVAVTTLPSPSPDKLLCHNWEEFEPSCSNSQKSGRFTKLGVAEQQNRSHSAQHATFVCFPRILKTHLLFCNNSKYLKNNIDK